MLAEIDSKPLARTALPAQPQQQLSTLDLALVDPSHPQRAMSEAFVRAIFQGAYQARLSSFYPQLLTITRGNGDYAAVAGIRPAGGEQLFSEHYLDAPVEQLLQAPRAGIAEIGNLAPAGAGQARWLICTLSAFLIGAGFTHVVFTSVPQLRNAFRRLGLPLTRLADADAQRLPEAQRAEWGSYYHTRPAVYAGDIVAGTPAINALLHADPGLSRLAQLAAQLGAAFARPATRSLSDLSDRSEQGGRVSPFFRSFEENSRNYLTKRIGKMGRSPTGAVDQSQVRQAPRQA
jgi:hypothetical protein